MYVIEMPNLHTHTLISVSYGVVKFCSLREEGRRGWFKNETYDYIRIDLI